MYFKRIYDEGLAQAAYIVACPSSGEAVIVDPLPDIDQYLDAVDAQGFQITGVVETHIHADFLSGGRDLARATGAPLYISGEQGEGWEYDGLEGLEVVELKDGESFKVGNVELEAMHTPGHTPEHMSYLITDGAQADEPMIALTGDFAFVGDLGRPDLLEEAAGEEGTAEEGARQQFESIKTFIQLPDHVQIWPGHGAGSACGKAMGAIPASTIGYERRNAWWAKYLEEDNPEAFADELLSGQPESPTYFRNMKVMNRDGLCGEGFQPSKDSRNQHWAGFELPAVSQLTPAGFKRAVRDNNALLLDIRPFEDFADEHIAGAVNLPSLESVSTHAGWVVPYDRPLVLLCDRADLDEARRRLHRVGLTDIVGHIPRMDQYAEASDHVPIVPAGQVKELRDTEDARVVDVRARSEFNAGHIPGAIHVHYGRLTDNLDELPDDKHTPLLVHCASGLRASIATSILKANGYEDVRNFPGGVAEWREDGFEVEEA